MLFLGGWTVAFGAGNKILSIASISAIYIADYLSFSMVNEVVATNSPPSSASSFLALGKGLNLMAYMVMGCAGPVLYGISASMPYTITGVFVLCWAAAVWVMLYLRAVVILSVDEEDEQDEGSEHESGSKRRSIDSASDPGRLRNPITIFSAFTGSTSWRECEHLYREREAAKETEMKEIKQLDSKFAIINLSGRCQHMESFIKEQQAMLCKQQETIDRLSSHSFPSDDHSALRLGHSGPMPSSPGQKTNHLGSSRVVPLHLDTSLHESDEESEDEADGVLVESLPTSPLPGNAESGGGQVESNML